MSSGLNKELVYSQQFVEPLLNTLRFITEKVLHLPCVRNHQAVLVDK